jgi:hypothetical protein
MKYTKYKCRLFTLLFSIGEWWQFGTHTLGSGGDALGVSFDAQHNDFLVCFKVMRWF